MAIRPYPHGPGTGDALVANALSQFAATTSLQLKTILTDETGSGSAVFGTGPTISSPTLVTPELGAAKSTGFPIYADEAAAILGGLASGNLYKTVTGEVRIKL